MIAKRFGLSRAALYRLFEPAGGVAGYIRKQRLDRAFQEITGGELSNRRISQIGHRFGFRNIHAFNRAFRKEYGMSPSDARKAARLGLSSLAILNTPSPDGPSLGAWLAQERTHGASRCKATAERRGETYGLARSKALRLPLAPIDLQTSHSFTAPVMAET